MTLVLLNLGSNIDPERHLQDARAALRDLPAFHVQKESPSYRSPAVGFDGPPFVNCGVLGQWAGALEDLQESLRHLEDRARRDRSAPRFSSRTLDIDVLLFGDHVSGDGGRIPRDELLEHAFVLRPSADIAPDWVHPLTRLSLAEHWRRWLLENDDPLERVLP